VGWVKLITLFTALSKSGGPATSQKKFFLGYIITFTGKMPLWRMEMKNKEIKMDEGPMPCIIK
jgi:hypothetical protein